MSAERYHHLDFALDASGKEVLPRDAHKYEQYQCAECKYPLDFCKGEVVKPYFRHRPVQNIDPTSARHNCTSGESIQHWRAKFFFISHLSRWSVTRKCDVCDQLHVIPHPFETGTATREVPVLDNKYRVDVLVKQGGKSVQIVEIVYKHRMTADKLLTLQQEYGHQHVYEFLAGEVIAAHHEDNKYILQDLLPTKQRCDSCTVALAAFHDAENDFKCVIYCSDHKCRGNRPKTQPIWSEKHGFFQFPNGASFAAPNVKMDLKNRQLLFRSTQGGCATCIARKAKRHCCNCRRWYDKNDMIEQYCNTWECRRCSAARHSNGMSVAMKAAIEEAAARTAAQSAVEAARRLHCGVCHNAFPTTTYNTIHKRWECDTCRTGICNVCKDKKQEQPWCPRCLADIVHRVSIIHVQKCTGCKSETSDQRQIRNTDDEVLRNIPTDFRIRPYSAAIRQITTINKCRDTIRQCENCCARIDCNHTRCAECVTFFNLQATATPAITSKITITQAADRCKRCENNSRDHARYSHCEACRDALLQLHMPIITVRTCPKCHDKKETQDTLTKGSYDFYHAQIGAATTSIRIDDQPLMHMCARKQKQVKQT